jgi:hypothetical protein
MMNQIVLGTLGEKYINQSLSHIKKTRYISSRYQTKI